MFHHGNIDYWFLPCADLCLLRSLEFRSATANHVDHCVRRSTTIVNQMNGPISSKAQRALGQRRARQVWSHDGPSGPELHGFFIGSLDTV
jgi:hypothetical protein